MWTLIAKVARKDPSQSADRKKLQEAESIEHGSIKVAVDPLYIVPTQLNTFTTGRYGYEHRQKRKDKVS